MKKLLLSILLILPMFAIQSCDEKEIPIIGKITFNEGTIPVPIFLPDGETKTIKFSSTLAWTAGVEAGKTWCTISPASGEAGVDITLTLTVAKNETFANRAASVNIVAGGVAMIAVKQYQNDSFSFTGAPKDAFPITGGTFTITTTENTGVPTVGELPEWITLTPAPAAKGLTETKLTFTVKANTTFDNREAKITITSGTATPQSFTVTQQRNPNSPITIPDANFKTYLLCNKIINTNDDNEISYSEAAVATKINCSNLEISSLAGIEHFTALTDLVCFSNKLTTLDVTKNTALTDLVCNDNKLTTLDVTKNTALTYLDCAENQLTTLDVTKNTKLTTLYCNENQLTTLDVSNNTKLTNLDCNENQLRTLDVSNNQELTVLYCFGNKLTSLDVSNNTALTDLYCKPNTLTALDVSNNTQLTFLDCADNGLTTLDVTENPALTRLYCNPMNDADGNNMLKTIKMKKGQTIADLSAPEKTEIVNP